MPVRFFILLLALLALPSARADVTGSVTLSGKPNSQDETFYATAKGCGESPFRTTENWKVGTKGELADVVIWIVDPKPAAHPPSDAELKAAFPEIEIKQIGCKYIPHVVAVAANTNFAVINGNPVLHNVRAKVNDGPGKPPGADVFNFGQSAQGARDEKQFEDPGLYTLQCDVHSWMQCWVKVLPHNYFAVSGADGAFKISCVGLADGEYKIDAWHPRFIKTLEQTVEVKNGAATINFQFDGTKSF